MEAQAAFLGPNLWDKTLPYDADLKVLNHVCTQTRDGKPRQLRDACKNNGFFFSFVFFCDRLLYSFVCVVFVFMRIEYFLHFISINIYVFLYFIIHRSDLIH